MNLIHAPLRHKMVNMALAEDLYTSFIRLFMPHVLGFLCHEYQRPIPPLFDLTQESQNKEKMEINIFISQCLNFFLGHKEEKSLLKILFIYVFFIAFIIFF